MMEERYLEYHDIIDSIGVIDKNGIVAINLFTDNRTSLVGKDVSFTQYVKESKAKLAPLFSNGFQSVDDKYTIAITYPIINRDTDRYVGLVAAYLPTVDYFAHYGNVHDINSQFVVAYDKNATLIAVGASQSLVGKPFLAM